MELPNQLFPEEHLDRVNEEISLIRKKDGVTFGTDSYLLAAFIRPMKRGSAIELGTGTGIVSLLCGAKERFARIAAFEIQEDFVSLAQRNVQLNHMEERISVRYGDIRLLHAADCGGEVDVVFANPPYMRTDSGKRNVSDRKYIARHEVCGTVEDFCHCAYRLLKHSGKFYCVWRPDRLSELIQALRQNRLEPKTMVFVHGDCEAEPSMVLTCAVKGGAPGVRILPPLFLHHTEDRCAGKRTFTRRAQRIYDTMSFYDT